VGSETITNIVLTNRISGVGAALTLGHGNANSTLIVRQAGAASAANRVTLDLSGLDTFSANVGRVLVGVGAGGPNRATGRLILAKTNTIIASGSAPAIDIGDSDVNNGGGSTLLLGETNALFADTITFARGKERGVNVLFNNPGSVAFFRAANGSSRVASFVIADGSTVLDTVNGLATANFSGGTVDALIGTLVVGRGTSGLRAAPVSMTGTLTFDQGTIDANNILLGANVANTTNSGIGTINVNGSALLVANAVLELGRTVNPIAGSNTVGNLNINGGTVRANSIINGGTGTTTVSLNGGTLVLSNAMGSTAQPLSNFALTNSTLQLRPVPGASALVVSNLLTAGTSNRLSIEALSASGQFQLIKYVGTLSGSGLNFVLGTLPSSFSGYLSNNAANSSIDLVVSNAPLIPAVLGSALLTSGGQLQFTVSGKPGGTYVVQTSTNLTEGNWVSVYTNVSAFTFQEETPFHAGQRFYRALASP
jgi:hypothetical protein